MTKGLFKLSATTEENCPRSRQRKLRRGRSCARHLSPYIAKESTSAALPSKAHSGSVTSDKARLFQSPGLESRSKMYLVNGDQLETIDDT